MKGNYIQVVGKLIKFAVSNREIVKTEKEGESLPATQESSNPGNPTAKEPWQMTKEKYVAGEPITRKYRSQVENTSGAARERASKQWDIAFGDAERVHKYSVADAIREGKPVPAEVLKDYPELAKLAKPAVPEVTIPTPYPKIPEARVKELKRHEELVLQAIKDKPNITFPELEQKTKLEPVQIDGAIRRLGKGIITKKEGVMTPGGLTPSSYRLTPEALPKAEPAEVTLDKQIREFETAQKAKTTIPIVPTEAQFVEQGLAELELDLKRLGFRVDRKSIVEQLRKDYRKQFAAIALPKAEAGNPEVKEPMHPTLGRPLTKEELALRERLHRTSLKARIEATEPPPKHKMTPQEATEAAELESELSRIIAREKQGDYCLPCVSSKHLQRTKDALTDALNIVKSEGQFTEVAEGKIQEAVYNLNGAEVDLERANYPEIIKPAVEAMHTQVRKLRNFLRPDQSGLELATVTSPKKEDLEKAILVVDDLSKLGYNLTKLLIKARAQEK